MFVLGELVLGIVVGFIIGGVVIIVVGLMGLLD